MSYEQLMEHARDIQRQAISAAHVQHGVRPEPVPGQPPINEVPGEAAARAGIRASFADVPALFEPFAMMPDPASFDALINDVGQAMSILSLGRETDDPISGDVYYANRVLSLIGASEAYLESWNGDAADRFRSEFVNTFPARVTNQFINCAVLRNALRAQQKMWTNARADIDKIAHDTLNALDNMDHCGQNTWTMSFTVIASVAAVAAVPISAGTSLAALTAATTVTAVGAASQVVAAHQLEPEKETTYHGETAEVVIEQTRRAVMETLSQIRSSEQKIAGALAAASAAMDRNPELFVAPRPQLADAVAGDVLSPDHLGNRR